MLRWNLATMKQANVALLLAATAMVGLPFAASRVIAQDHDEALKKRFLEEAPSRWEEYNRLVKTVQGSLRFSLTGPGKEYDGQFQAEFKANDKARLLILQSLGSTDRGGKVFAANPQYIFTLQRKAPSASWVLTGVDKVTVDKIASVVVRRINMAFDKVAMLTRLNSVGLAEAVREPDFSVQRVRPRQRNGEELVEVVFESPHVLKDLSQRDYNSTQGGSMVLDPKRFWCVRGLDLNLKTGVASGTYKLSVELDPSTTFPLPKRCIALEEYALNSGGQVRLKHESEFSLTVPARPPADEEFTLAAFGLPEPFDTTPKGTRWYFWLAAAAIVCFAGGAVLRRVRRRGAPEAQPA